jgi:predicted nucleotide-binding protein (sugar kinase/HSP70/actin superfamily)
MGVAYIPLKAAFGKVGVEVLVPPPSSRRTLSLGVRHSPEFVCLPYKLILGNFIEALEMGADTLLMVEGTGLCRLSYYARVLERALEDLGYDFQMVTTRIFERRVFGLPRLLKRLSADAPMPEIVSAIKFALSKVDALDAVEVEVHKVRARETEVGAADTLWRAAQESIDSADSYPELAQARAIALADLAQVPNDPDYLPLKVGIIGEFYVLLEPFVNLDVERELGKLGVEVHRAVMLSQWTKASLIWRALGFSQDDEAHRAAMPFLKRDVGGDGWESVGETALATAHGYDGMVHLSPFTCMPEIIAQNIIPQISQRDGIPVLDITCDEQMGQAGMVTRLEAFVEMMKRRKQKGRWQ